MALQSGVGLSKIVILVGAGYTSTFLFNNGKLSDILGELQSLVKGWEKKGNSSKDDSDYSDAVAAQVRRLAMEVRQMATSRQITIMNGNSGQIGNITSLIVPAATLGALGYGYMWWKGLSFSSLMYVTKRNMENAVSNLTKHLELVSNALDTAKKHLTQRIEKLNGKLDEQVEISKSIKNEVTGVRADLTKVGFNLDDLQSLVDGLDGKICSLEQKQDLANIGVMYLCQFVDGVNGQKMKMPPVLQEQIKLCGKSRGYLPSSDKGLKEIHDLLMLGNANGSITDGTV